MEFDITADVHVGRDQLGKVRQLRHTQKPYTADQAGLTATKAPMTPRALADQYLRDVASLYELAPTATVNFAAALAQSPTNDASQLRFKEEKSVQNSTIISYVQTLYGLPVWDAGVTVRMNNQPLQVTSSHSAAHSGLVDVAKPAADFAYLPNKVDQDKLKKSLGASEEPVVTSTRLLIYRYEEDQRIDPQITLKKKGGFQGEDFPRLPLPALTPSPEIKEGQHYVVSEVLFSLAYPNWGTLNWRAFLDPQSGQVLYLRALVSCAANGHIFHTDPVTQTGISHTAATSPALLDPLRHQVPLLGLNPLPFPSAPQVLSGTLVALREVNAPSTPMPTRLEPFNFNYSCPTADFAAVNAYYHCDAFYRFIEGLGFNLADYFDGTTFPVPVDPHALNNAVNAQARGNASGNGMGAFVFGRISPGQTMGIATDVRVVLHEFGHSVLWDHVNSPNFGFAHSPGDAFAAILHDPESKLTDAARFETFPFMKANGSIDRRHDRKVDEGWAWFGSEWDTQYGGEEVLSTTLFRIYRAAGGDSKDVAVRRAASRHAVYLILAGVHGLFFQTPDPDVYVTALIDADNANSFEDEPGGTMDKVIRWSFEKQGLYQPFGAVPPFSTPGAPPDVDVYIEDGRNGEYMPYLANFDNASAAAVWNRTASDDNTVDQAPTVGAQNFVYAIVRNRGTQAAQNVRVRGFQSRTANPLKWPTDWKPMTTASLLIAGGVAAGASEKVGPFQWTPEFAGQSVLVSVSATGDRSHAETVIGTVSNARLVPLDNNIVQRKF